MGARQPAAGAAGLREHGRGSSVPVPACQRCHFPVPARAMGCKNPCPNCGTVYPLGDCSD
jgi:predicted RNA-binding Zn-ribbon protein involved in translation (DUF1610 family)